MHRFSPELFASLRNQRIRVLRDATQLWYIFHQSHSMVVVAFSSFVGKSSLSVAFCLVVINLVMREQTLITGFAIRFCFVKLTLGRMPTFTERSRASTFQIVVCTVVEEWYQDYFFPWYFSTTHFDLVSLTAQMVERLSVSVLVHDHHSHAGICTGFPSNIGLFLSTGNKYLLLLQRHSFPFDSWPLLLFQFSRAWHKSFVIEVSDLYFSSPWCFIIDNLHRHLLMMNLHVVQFQYCFELRELMYFHFVQTLQDIIRGNYWHWW